MSEPTEEERLREAAGQYQAPEATTSQVEPEEEVDAGAELEEKISAMTARELAEFAWEVVDLGVVAYAGDRYALNKLENEKLVTRTEALFARWAKDGNMPDIPPGYALAGTAAFVYGGKYLKNRAEDDAKRLTGGAAPTQSVTGSQKPGAQPPPPLEVVK